VLELEEAGWWCGIGTPYLRRFIPICW